MNALLPGPTSLPTKENPVPISANEQLCRSLMKGGLLATRIRDLGEFTPEDLPALRDLRDELEALSQPATDKAIVVELEKLFAHYPQQELPDNALKSRWRDWLTDLADVPLDVLVAGCRDWRRSAERFAPTPGQLLDKLAVYSGPRKAALGLTKLAIRLLDPESAQ